MNGSGAAAYRSDDEFDDYSTTPNRSGSFVKGPSNPSAVGSISSSGGLMSTGNPTSLSQQKVDHNLFSYNTASTSQNQGMTSGNRTGGGNICCLSDDGRRCQRTAGNASYSKRVQKTVFYKRLRLDVDNSAQHTYICDHHKNIIQTARVRVKKESDEEGPENQDEMPDIDLYQLQVNTLRRYKKHFKIPTRPGLNKAQLADILTKHFKTIPVNEKEIITYFIYAVKSGRNKLDNNNTQPSGGLGMAVKEEYLDRY